MVGELTGTGGIERFYEMGHLDYAALNVPLVPETALLSLTGWGHRSTLQHLVDGVDSNRIPQLWLCSETEQLSPVFQRFMIRGAEPRLITENSRALGICYADEYAEYVLLTGVLPSDITAARKVQTTSVFENMERGLLQVGMTFDNVVRTWLYVDKILEWYDDFNRARDGFFLSRQVYDGLIPASTGIGSANLANSAVAACVLAVKPRDTRCVIKPVASPLQCPALDYHSSFSRAVEITTPAAHSLFVSGTASIAPGGESLYPDDPSAQLQLTMEVVQAILQSREMDWEHVTRGVMYLKEAAFDTVWQAWLAEHKLEQFPQVVVVADVCRDDLLVEIEVDAIRQL